MRKKFVTKLKKVLAGVLCAATLMTTIQVPEVKAGEILGRDSVVVHCKVGTSIGQILSISRDVIYKLDGWDEYSVLAGEFTNGADKTNDPEFAKVAGKVEPTVRIYLKDGVSVNQAINKISQNKNYVVFVENFDPNVKYENIDDWYYDQLGIRKAWELISKVKHRKVKVAVLDQGVDSTIPKFEECFS